MSGVQGRYKFLKKFAGRYESQDSYVGGLALKDRLEIRGRRLEGKSILNIGTLSFVQTQRNQLSTICGADGPPFSPERSNVLHTFPCSNKALLTFHQADCCGSLQTVRPEAYAASFQTKRTQNIRMLSIGETFAYLSFHLQTGT